jgi:hypothetical protein
MASGDPTRGWPTGQHADHTPASSVERAGPGAAVPSGDS